jgi:hypothetical protein
MLASRLSMMRRHRGEALGLTGCGPQLIVSGRLAMIRKQVWIVIVTVTVLAWSVVMTALGQIAAMGALVPSLGLLVHQIVQAVQSAGGGRPPGSAEPAPAARHRGPGAFQVTGRKLGPISDTVGETHRAWLEPLRRRFLASGETIGELADQSRYSKSKISELLRGEGLYPRWEIIHSVLRILQIPPGPMCRLWMAAALEANRKKEWIAGCIDTTVRTVVVVAYLEA